MFVLVNKTLEHPRSQCKRSGDNAPTHVVRTIRGHTNVTHGTDETRLVEDFRRRKRDADVADGTVRTIITINEVTTVSAPGTPLREKNEKIKDHAKENAPGRVCRTQVRTPAA
jgi:hypothetical protein